MVSGKCFTADPRAVGQFPEARFSGVESESQKRLVNTRIDIFKRACKILVSRCESYVMKAFTIVLLGLLAVLTVSAAEPIDERLANVDVFAFGGVAVGDDEAACAAEGCGVSSWLTMPETSATSA